MSERKPQSRSPGGRRGRFFALAIAVTIGIQMPLVAGLAHLWGHLLPPLVLAAALTGGFLSTVLGPRGVWGAPSRARLYLVLWPFFVWWTLSLLFALFAPLALVVHGISTFTGSPISTAAALWSALAAGLAGTVLALRSSPRVRRHEIAIAGLPSAFEGYRIAQISDLHCGPFASRERVDGWVAAVNRLGADLVAVTGDLIASGPTFVPVVAEALGALRARDGVFASMGNHDYFTEGEEMVAALEAAGLTLLRNRGVEVRRDGAAIYVAGVDDTWTKRHDLDKALAARPPAMSTLLLAHDPALFPDAASRAVDLTLSGHTHGGQIGVPFFAKRFNLARVMTPFTTGLYRSGAAALYVSRGLGSTGLPVRIFVPAEITMITLKCGGQPSTAAEPARVRADVLAGDPQTAP